jgi:serine/threonine protein phosphatase PrpC
MFVAGMTHPGVEHRQNQDAFFIFRDEARGHVVAGVLDGHGRELGQAAAHAARDSFEADIPSLAADDFAVFRRDPVGEFQRVFCSAHEAIKKVRACMPVVQGRTTCGVDASDGRTAG